MKFFVLNNPKTGETPTVTDFVLEEGFAVGEASRCSVCGNFISSLPLLPPIRAELEAWGASFGDLAFGGVSELLVSERFWQLYTASGLIGLFDVGPVEVTKVTARKKKCAPPPRYRCCRVPRSRAAIDQMKSGIERDRLELCSECRQGGIIKRARRVIVEPETWSGEDIFYARGLPGRIIVSKRFKEFCDLNQVSNCLLVPAEEFSFDHYPSEKKKSESAEPRSMN